MSQIKQHVGEIGEVIIALIIFGLYIKTFVLLLASGHDILGFILWWMLISSVYASIGLWMMWKVNRWANSQIGT